MLRVKSLRRKGRSIMREDNDLSVWLVRGEVSDLAIEPREIMPMRVMVSLHGPFPILDAGEIFHFV